MICKMFQVVPLCSRWTFAQNIKFYPQNVFFGARAGCGDATSLYKNLVKNTKTYLTSIGSRFRSPFFLCLIQNLKAVAMGLVAAIAFFLAK
jgi:hypothetical protein